MGLEKYKMLINLKNSFVILPIVLFSGETGR